MGSMTSAVIDPGVLHNDTAECPLTQTRLICHAHSEKKRSSETTAMEHRPPHKHLQFLDNTLHIGLEDEVYKTMLVHGIWGVGVPLVLTHA
jgi:hypothetical protein